MPIRTSETELRHLVIAWLAIALAFTIILQRGQRLELPSVFIVALLTVGVAFICHELAHKVVAQRYGAWSEFRMAPLMLLLAIFTAFLGFIFVAPGAVMIFNPYLTRAENGKIALAGPMTNVLLAAGFFALFRLVPTGILGTIGTFGMTINAWLALFNLIPVSVLDGRKVLAWDSRMYGVAVVLAILMLVGTMVLL
jgi:Zn-dependent protease